MAAKTVAGFPGPDLFRHPKYLRSRRGEVRLFEWLRIVVCLQERRVGMVPWCATGLS